MNALPILRVVVPAGVLLAADFLLFSDRAPSAPETVPLTVEASRELAEEAQTLVRRGRVGEALDALERLHDAFPANEIYASQLAQAYEVEGRPADAGRLWDLFMERSPVAWEACPSVGDAYWDAGERATALERYRLCRTLEPSNPDHLLALALAHERLGEVDRAAALYAEGADLAPRYVDFHIARARILLRSDAAAAESALRDIVSTAPGHPDALLALGLSLERQGRFDEAGDVYERGLQAAPAYGDIALGVARVALRRGDAAAARHAAERQLAVRADDVDALLVLAMALEQQGQLDRAWDAARRAIELAPAYGDLYLVAGRVAEAQERFDDALALYDRLLERDPSRTDVAAARARATRRSDER